MRIVIINTAYGWQTVECKATWTISEREECPQDECMRRHFRSDDGIESCPYIKNGMIINNEKYLKYIQQ